MSSPLASALPRKISRGGKSGAVKVLGDLGFDIEKKQPVS
jgi:hypothetical protein